MKTNWVSIILWVAAVTIITVIAIGAIHELLPGFIAEHLEVNP